MALANNILMDSDMLLDSDIGIYRVIMNEFPESDYFLHRFDNVSIEVMRSELLTMEENNVLKLLMDDEFINSADSLIDEIRETYKEKIVDNSSFTKLLNLVRMYLDTELISVTVICRNSFEEDKIKKVRPEIKTVLYKQINVMLANRYDSWYFKDYKDALKLNPKGKNIYLGNYNFNIKNDTVNKTASILSTINVLKIAAVYDAVDIHG